MKLTFLGTGTSTGIPQLRCNCITCRSTDQRDKRLRCSALLERDGHSLLIDCGPDFREQMLRYHPHGDIDALLVTHHHYDHVGGTDDLRPYCHGKKAFPVYCNQDVSDDLHRRMPYCFTENRYPGVPTYDIHVVSPFERFEVCGIDIIPLHVMHYRLEILGFRIGPMAYITDAKTIPPATIEAIRGVDTLVINSLRLMPHLSHMNLDESLAAIDLIAPRVAYLTHLSHDMGTTAQLVPMLPPHVKPAIDGLTIDIPTP